MTAKLTKVTLEINDIAAVTAALRRAAHESDPGPASNITKAIAEQIEAQAPKPRRAEPVGDCVVVDRNGTTWTRYGGEWRSREGSTNWTALVQWDPKIYHREPRVDVVEALIEEFEHRFATDGRDCKTQYRLEMCREFVRRLLGGAS